MKTMVQPGVQLAYHAQAEVHVVQKHNDHRGETITHGGDMDLWESTIRSENPGVGTLAAEGGIFPFPDQAAAVSLPASQLELQREREGAGDSDCHATSEAESITGVA
jgi:hypothetical protein